MGCLLSQLELLADGSCKFCKNVYKHKISHDTSLLVYVLRRCEIYHVAYTNTHAWLAKMWCCQKPIFLFRQADSLCEASTAVASCFAMYSAFAGGWMRSLLVMRHSHTSKIFRYHDVHLIFVMYAIRLAGLSCVLNILLAFGDVCAWRIVCCCAR